MLALKANPLSHYNFSLRNGKNLFLLVCYAIIIFGIGYRIDYIIEFNPLNHIFSDTQRHWEQGTDVLRFDPMSMTDPILYQLYIGALAKLTLKNHALVAFYTILLACFTPWLWYRFMRELQPSKVVAVAGWALISLNPSWISIYGYFMQETLFLPLLGWSLWMTWRVRRTHSTRLFGWMVLLWCLTGLTRGIAIPMAAVACTWLWLEQKDKVHKAAISLLIFGLILGPLTYRSYQIVHIFAPHGMGNMNMIYSKSGNRAIKMGYDREGAKWYYIFQSPAAEAKPFEPFSDWQSRRRGTVEAFVDVDEGSRDWKKELAKHPMTLDKYLWITADNLILLFFTESWPDSNRSRTLGEINYQTRWLWAPLTVIILIASIVYRRRLKSNWMYPAMIVTWFVLQGLLPISVNEGRYRMPFTGMIIVQAILLIGTRRKPELQQNMSPVPVVYSERPRALQLPPRLGPPRSRTPKPRLPKRRVTHKVQK